MAIDRNRLYDCQCYFYGFDACLRVAALAKAGWSLFLLPAGRQAGRFVTFSLESQKKSKLKDSVRMML
ncbi:hypothetical protein [Roseivirga sp. UBA1976]|uniref:hypothetical protein n=1 Tax=Roseivirga sp. UBA1976 TaxID=1947386 RepID=UPI00257E2A12|nr:hypothetical protein [Roseivirga sp. UBA1976]